MLRKLIKVGAGLGTLYIASTILTFIAGVMLTRQLGAEGFGLYAFGLAVASIVGMFTEFGFPILAMREVSAAEATRNWCEVRGLIRFSDRVIILASIAAIFATWTWVFLLDSQSAVSPVIALAILLPPIVGVDRLRGLSVHALGYTLLGQFSTLVVRPGVFLLLIAGMWLANATIVPKMAMLMQVIAAIIALLVTIFFFLRVRPNALRHADAVYTPGRWLAACVPFGLTEGLRSLQGQLAILLLGFFVTSAHVGNFRVAQSIAALAVICTSVVNLTIAPFISRLTAEQRKHEIERIASYAAIATVAASLLPTIIFYAWGNAIITYVFGAEFEMAVTCLQIILIGYLISFLLGPVATICNMMGFERQVTSSAVLAVFTQAIFSAILIPHYSANGAAIALAASTVLASIYLTSVMLFKAQINPTVVALLFRKGSIV